MLPVVPDVHVELDLVAGDDVVDARPAARRRDGRRGRRRDAVVRVELEGRAVDVAARRRDRELVGPRVAEDKVHGVEAALGRARDVHVRHERVRRRRRQGRDVLDLAAALLGRQRDERVGGPLVEALQEGHAVLVLPPRRAPLAVVGAAALVRADDRRAARDGHVEGAVVRHLEGRLDGGGRGVDGDVHRRPAREAQAVGLEAVVGRRAGPDRHVVDRDRLDRGRRREGVVHGLVVEDDEEVVRGALVLRLAAVVAVDEVRRAVAPAEVAERVARLDGQRRGDARHELRREARADGRRRRAVERPVHDRQLGRRVLAVRRPRVDVEAVVGALPPVGCRGRRATQQRLAAVRDLDVVGAGDGRRVRRQVRAVAVVRDEGPVLHVAVGPVRQQDGEVVAARPEVVREGVLGLDGEDARVAGRRLDEGVHARRRRGLGLGRVRRGRARRDRQREGRAPVRVAQTAEDVRAARLDAQLVGARLEGRVRDVVLAVADVVDAARERRGPQDVDGDLVRRVVLVERPDQLVAGGVLGRHAEGLLHAAHGRRQGGPRRRREGEVRAARHDRRRERRAGDVGRVVERRGGDRLVDDGVAGPGEAHARRARELAPLHDEVVEGAARQRHLGALAVRREGRVLPAVHDELVVHVDARAVVEEDVERVHVRRGRHDLAAPARRHVVAAVGRHGAVAPVEVDLGVHAHDRRVALQPGVVEVLGREAALHELAHDDVGVARRRRRVAARVGRQAGDLLLDAHARRAARERRRVAGHDLAGRARRVAAREQRRVAAQELEVAELRAERDHPVRLAVVPLGLGDVDAVERRQRLEGRLDGRGRRVVGDRRRRLVVERQGEGAVQGRRVAARRRHRLLLVDVRRGLHLAQVAELLREGDRVLDGVAQHLLGDVDLVDGRDLLEPRLDRRRRRVEGDVARVVALVGHGEGPAQAGLALDELDDVVPVGVAVCGAVGVEHDEVPDVAHGAHEGDVPRRALEGVGVDAVLGRARRHDDVVDAVELLEGVLDLERRRRGAAAVELGLERRRSVRAAVELQNEFAFG